VLVEGNGRPLAVAIGGANTPDAKLLKATLEAIVVERPAPTEAAPQHLCLDKGYDNAPAEAVVTGAGYVPHIRRIGEEKLDDQQEKTCPARRWVVERTFAWLSRCRAILVRYDRWRLVQRVVRLLAFGRTDSPGPVPQGLPSTSRRQGLLRTAESALTERRSLPQEVPY